MVSQKFIIQNESGLHARPAGELAKIAMKCKANVWLMVGERKVQAKSILNLMAAAIKKGTEIEVVCDGETEEEDLKTLAAAIESGLGE